MVKFTRQPVCSALIALAVLLSYSASAEKQSGWAKAFDGKTLNGWKLYGGAGPGYVIRDGGILACPADGGGNLFLEKEYSDFSFKFDFRLHKSANNGIAVRAPLYGNPSFTGMEIQILDDRDEMYKDIKPYQAHGSVYGVIPAIRDKLKPVGGWNHEEITAVGPHIKVVLNGSAIVDGNLLNANDPRVFAEHPGIFREKGFVGFLGHGPAELEFKEIYIKDLESPHKDNAAPAGYTALFNGKNLAGWKGLVSDPPHRAKMTPQELADATAKATEEALKHWGVENGEIIYDGKNNNLCTVRDYADFELLVDWKIGPKGDSGIYLRGSPQVQIWDPSAHPARSDSEKGDGSGGLYNNATNPNRPLVLADKPVGEWNHMRILMVGDKVTVHLNDILVVNWTTMENYWERDKPMYPTGAIELQHHGDHLWFKNIYVREIPHAK